MLVNKCDRCGKITEKLYGIVHIKDFHDINIDLCNECFNSLTKWIGEENLHKIEEEKKQFDSKIEKSEAGKKCFIDEIDLDELKEQSVVIGEATSYIKTMQHISDEAAVEVVKAALKSLSMD